MLEIGAYCGRSTVTMALALTVELATVFSIDHHKGDEGTGPADTLTAFRDNVRAFGVEGKVVPMIGTVNDVAKLWTKDACVDMAFIDGAHDVASVTRDLALALRLVKSGGRILLHDRTYPGVVAAMRAHGVEAVEVAGSIAVCERR